jgi:N,N'-diacetyllegionaminate synthase
MKPFVIAEIGSNHDGSEERAHQLIDLAHGAGASAVKFQFFRGDNLVRRRRLPETALSVFEPNELPVEWLPRLKAHVSETGMQFIVTTFDPEHVAVVDEYVDMHKVASFELLDKELLRAIAATGKRVILSTGMADLDEIAGSAAMFPIGKVFGVLHCVSAYPAPLHDANVKAISTLKIRFPHLPIGLSDHTVGPTAAVIATSLGASVIEKHFDGDYERDDIDHGPFAMRPAEFADMVTMLGDVGKVMEGSGIVGVRGSEAFHLRYQVRRD